MNKQPRNTPRTLDAPVQFGTARGKCEEADTPGFALPTVPRPMTTAELERDPVARNSTLGYCTNFMNLLDPLRIPEQRLEAVPISRDSP